MEYFDLATKVKSGAIEVFPSFKIKAGDIVSRSGDFYAVYDEETKLWSTDEETVINQVDSAIHKYIQENPRVMGAYMNNSESGSWAAYRKYIQSKPITNVQFDSKLLFSNHQLKREDYATRTLSYSPKKGSVRAFNKILDTLYDQTEAEKIRWFIGALLTGDSEKIQKFAVFFGPPGSGKSTVINIIEGLVEDYAATFVAKDLVSNNNQFGTAAFKTNPILAVQHDGDLSRIEDNSILNQLVSHETTILNEKYKGQYPFKFNGLIILGTNKAVKITDSKSGMLRRILDIVPSGIKLPYDEYKTLLDRVEFEKPAIAYECIKIYKEMGVSYYENHKPFKMMELTDFFYDFILENLPIMKNGISLKHAVELYIKYCDDNKLDVKAARQKVRGQLEDYFLDYTPRKKTSTGEVRDFYYNFDEKKITAQKYEPTSSRSMAINSPISYLDNYAVYYPAQYATEKETPLMPWSECKTTLKDIDTSRLHYLKPQKNHIVIDFDLKDEDGNKSMQKNIQAANKFPTTYGEFSKSGNGVHLHYIYDGDIDELSNIYAEDIEIKLFRGRASLRRKFTYSNGINTIATISGGLPLKEKKDMYDENILWTEKGIRTAIGKALRKEHHGATAPEIDFIAKILLDAERADVEYDVTSLRPSVLSFAMGSTNQANKCIAKVNAMNFKSGDAEIDEYLEESQIVPKEDLVIFDVEVYKNLFVIVWKRYGKEPVAWINPTAQQVDTLSRMNLVGFYNRKYDNHILYGAITGMNNMELYELSQRIISDSPNATFLNAYNMSYADIYEYSATKQSLKKWEIELGIKHDECEFPWDEEVPEMHWDRVVEYCTNDVIATEQVFDFTIADYDARCIIAELSGLPVNSKTQSHAERIIFGKDKNPQSKFVYTDLSEMFPGYKFEFGKSTYRDFVASEGGFVLSCPGIWDNVGLFDVESEHPTSAEQLNVFGPYTQKYNELRYVRLAIKHGDYDLARSYFDGALIPYLTDEAKAKKLSYALKIIINIVYGMTSAPYANPFKDPRNIDNIVAKRGALFMIDLYYAIEEQGYKVIHIKTDSVKVANADEKIAKFIDEFGAKYGYKFEYEAHYKKVVLLDKAQYFAQYEDDSWTTTGTLPSHPWVYKTLCSHEEISVPGDVGETKESKKGPIYIGDRFVGKNVRAIPIITERGEELKRLLNGKESYVQGTKGYKWILYSEFEFLKYTLDDVDQEYFRKIVKDTMVKVANVGNIWTAFDYNAMPDWAKIEQFVLEK